MIVEEKPAKIDKKVGGLSKELHLSLLKQDRPIYITVRGTSMYPFIKNADIIKIEPIDKEEEIKIGDMVAVDMKNESGPWFFVHRVVKITVRDRERIYFTKGDAHKKGLDSPVTIKLIAGKITEIVRDNFMMQLERPSWQIFNPVIAKISLRCPGILVILSSFISLVIEWRLFLPKLNNRLKNGNPIFYNSEEFLLTCIGLTDSPNNGAKKSNNIVSDRFNSSLF